MPIWSHSIAFPFVFAFVAHRFAMRRASANLCSFARMSELWSGVEQAAFMRRLTARLLTNPDSADREEAFKEFDSKMRAIADHLLIQQSRLRFVWLLPSTPSFLLDLVYTPRRRVLHPPVSN